VRTFIALLILLPLYSRTGEPKPLPDTTPWDIPALKKPPAFDWVEKDKPVKSLQYASISYRGETTTPIARARLHYTIEPHQRNKERYWETRVLEHNGKSVRGEAPPEEATAWFIDVRDTNGLLISSPVRIP